MMMLRILLVALLTFTARGFLVAETPAAPADPLGIDNLVAWCIVPFDARQRGPAERADMVRRLGLRRVAYDWRAKHVAEFEDEILQYQRHDIEYFAFWSWHDAIEPLIRKHGIRPQIWTICPTPDPTDRVSRVREAAESLLPLVEKTRALGLKLGIYNHGGWSGEPANMVAICQYLRDHHEADHVGIVYNFHHGHDHIADFDTAFASMQPMLLCLNLNGMIGADELKSNPAGKILPIGSGTHERAMIQTVLESGYQGPIGILGHRPEIDVEIALRQNLDGLSRLTP
jgi:hypothetical protein